MSDDLHYIFLDIPKCSGDTGAPLIEKFGHALGNLANYDHCPEEYHEELLQLLFDSANLSNFTPEEKIKYDNDMTTERDILNQIDYAREQGLEMGREQGREQGAAQSKAEIARAMLAKGFDAATVQELTGISEERLSVQ